MDQPEDDRVPVTPLTKLELVETDKLLAELVSRFDACILWFENDPSGAQPGSEAKAWHAHWWPPGLSRARGMATRLQEYITSKSRNFDKDE